MYQFILYRWQYGKFTEADIDLCVTKGYITEEQATTIKNAPKLV